MEKDYEYELAKMALTKIDELLEKYFKNEYPEFDDYRGSIFILTCMDFKKLLRILDKIMNECSVIVDSIETECLNEDITSVNIIYKQVALDIIGA